MNRQAIINEFGPYGWFDMDKAQCWQEDSWFDGSNMISRATGSQWAHQELYRTASGNWVLCDMSQYQNVETTYKLIEPSTAAHWLVANCSDDELSELDLEIRSTIDRLLAETEM